MKLETLINNNQNKKKSDAILKVNILITLEEKRLELGQKLDIMYRNSKIPVLLLVNSTLEYNWEDYDLALNANIHPNLIPNVNPTQSVNPDQSVIPTQSVSTTRSVNPN